jgi:outer membrane immunogenic protein
VKTFSAALLGATLLITTASLANAADVYDGKGGLKDEAPLPWPTNIWAGFYLGGHLGGTFDDELDFGDGDVADVDEALAGGIHAGYNWQRGANLVYGLEVDLDAIGDEVDGIDPVTSYVSTLRGRLGYAYGNTLFYGTGGLALLGFDDDLSDALGGDLDDPSVGWVAGAGVEHKFSPRWSLGVEGLYYDVSSDVDGQDFDVERDFWTVRARATYHIQR